MDKLRKSVKPVHQMARVTALVPIRYGQTSLYETKPFNLLDFIYNPIIIILFISGTLTKYFLYDNKLKQNSILPFFHEHAIIMYSIFVLIIQQFKYNEIQQTAMLFDETEIKLRILGCDLRYKWIHQIAKWIVLIFFVTFVCIQIPITYSLVFFEQVFEEEDISAVVDSEETSLMYRLSKLGLIVCARIIDAGVRCYFIGFMMILRTRFTTVNKEINKIAKLTEIENKTTQTPTTNTNTNKNSGGSETSTKKRKKNTYANKINNLKILTVVSHTGEEDLEEQLFMEQIKSNGIAAIKTPDSSVTSSNTIKTRNPTQHIGNIGSNGVVNKLKIRNSINSSNSTNNNNNNNNRNGGAGDPFGHKYYLKIRLLADIHDKLCLNLSTVNSIFSIQLLFLTGIEFVLITASLYYEYIRVDRGFADYIQIFTFTMDVLGNLLRCFQLLFIIWICSNTCSHANQASFYIHKIVYMEESKLKREIENFSMQLLHNKVQISAGGFFPIDFTLLYTIVGAITTYLVILVQFYLAAKAADAKKKAMRNRTLVTIKDE